VPFCANCKSGHSGRDPQCPTCGAPVDALATVTDEPVAPIASTPVVATPTFRPGDRYLIGIGVPVQAGFAAWYYSTTNAVNFVPVFGGYLVFVGLLWWAVGALAKAKRRRASSWWIFTICFGPFPLLILLFLPKKRADA
jgi:hypothetical protein